MGGLLNIQSLRHARTNAVSGTKEHADWEGLMDQRVGITPQRFLAETQKHGEASKRDRNNDLHPAHKKQLPTYLRLTGLKLAYLLNSGEAMMTDGIARTINGERTEIWTGECGQGNVCPPNAHSGFEKSCLISTKISEALAGHDREALTHRLRAL